MYLPKQIEFSSFTKEGDAPAMRGCYYVGEYENGNSYVEIWELEGGAWEVYTWNDVTGFKEFISHTYDDAIVYAAEIAVNL